MKIGLVDYLAQRTSFTKPGEKRTMIDLAANLDDVISLGRGDPDLKTPPEIIQAGIEAMSEGHIGYTQWAGIPELRAAIAEMYSREKDVPVQKEEVMVTVGAQEAVFLTMMSLLDPGDEIILPEPRYTPYDMAISMAGGRIVSVPTYEEDNFVVQTGALEKAITEKTKALLLVTPNNPTGSVIPREILEEIAALAQQHDLIVISDEIYSGLVYDGIKAHSIASLPGMKERTIIINAFSKTYTMTGWRVGYLIAQAETVEIMTEMKAATTICAPNVSQRAALYALKHCQERAEEIRNTYDRRRKYVMKRLDEMGVSYSRPDGAFYVFANLKPYCQGRKVFELTKDLLREKRVLVFPGTIFGQAGEGFVRISLLAPMEKLEEAFDRIEEFIKEKERQDE